MSQEATMIALDNSSYMKNGDFIPDRFIAQREAIHFICNNLKRQNPENTCGLITLSDCQVLCTLTIDTSKVFSKIIKVQPDGNTSFCTSIAIAHLALRNRQFRNQKPKILIFLGSPIEDSEEELIRVAKKLKKEKVSVVIINFGELRSNENKLNDFINAINGKDSTTSQIITIPAGNGITEYLRSNPIIVGDKPGIERSTADFGLDIDDPDLAYALRVSLEDQRIRINQPAASEPILSAHPEINELDEHELTMSVLDATAAHLDKMSTSDQTVDIQGMTEDEQIQYAINVSLAAQEQNFVPESDKKNEHSANKRLSTDDKDGSISEKKPKKLN